MKNLAMVSLNGNKLESLPAEIASWTKVAKLFLNKNQLRHLPDEIGKMAGYLLKCFPC